MTTREIVRVGAIDFAVGWVDDWFRCSYPEARYMASSTAGFDMPAGPVLFRHRFVDEPLSAPIDLEELAQRMRKRTRRVESITMVTEPLVGLRHRHTRDDEGCPLGSGDVKIDHLGVPLLGEALNIDDMLVSIIRCPWCRHAWSLSYELRSAVVAAPFSVGGFLYPHRGI